MLAVQDQITIAFRYSPADEAQESFEDYLVYLQTIGVAHMMDKLIAARAAALAEAQAAGGAGGTVTEDISLLGTASGDNGNGGTYSASVTNHATIEVTQSETPFASETSTDQLKWEEIPEISPLTIPAPAPAPTSGSNASESAN